MPRPVAVVLHAQARTWPSLAPAAPLLPPGPSGEPGRRWAAWRLFEDLLAALGPEGSLPHFFVDGHLAALEDYSNVHPEAEETLRSLASAGKLGLGPFQALMDGHASSGETIVHNLQAGCRSARRLGEMPRVALLPPTWGHIAQLPQLLRQVGTEHVVVMAGPWRLSIPGAFWWRSPDGSSVRAEYRESHGWQHCRPCGAGTEAEEGQNLAEEASALLGSLSALEEGPERELLAPGQALLWLQHADIAGPGGTGLEGQAQCLADVVEIANARQDKYVLQVTGPRNTSTASNAPACRRSWRSPRPAPPGPSAAAEAGWDGVFSGRLDVASAAAAAERSVERLAEPLCALWTAPEQWPEAEFGVLWDLLVSNSGWRLRATSRGAAGAHREPAAYPASSLGGAYPYAYVYAHVAHVATSAQRQALASAATAVHAAGLAVINPSSHARSAVVEVAAGMGGRPGGPTSQDLSNGRALVWAHDVPGYGWATLAAATAGPGGASAPPAPVRRQRGQLGEPSLDNGLVHLSVSRGDGSFAINGHWGLGHLVDEDDAGDVHGFRPSGGNDLGGGGHGEGAGGYDAAVDRPTSVDVEVTEDGPLRGRVVVVRHYSGATMAGEVRTELELRAGEQLVRVTTTFFNQRPGHRLRTVLALPARADRSLADCAFATVERPTQPEASYPAKSFVCAGGLVLAHDGLCEYMVGAGGWALALAMLRSTSAAEPPGAAAEQGGGASRAPGWEGGARLGPWTRAWPGPEQLGHQLVRFAVAVGDPSQGPAGGLDPWQLTEEAFVPLQLVEAPGGGHLADKGTHLSWKGARVSSVRRQGGTLQVRAFNPSPEPVLVEAPGNKGWLVDLQDNTVAEWEDSFALGPWSIVTVRIC